MAKVAVLIGSKSDVWSSIAIGSSAEMREKFKRDSFPGFAYVRYLDTSGTTRRKKGTPKAKPKPAPKK